MASASPVCCTTTRPGRPGVRRWAGCWRSQRRQGGTANIGVWARDDDGWRWMVHLLTPQTVQQLLPEAAGLGVVCHLLPNLRAVNIELPGLLDEGVPATTRFDPQAKGLAEWLRSRTVDVPEQLLMNERDVSERE